MKAWEALPPEMQNEAVRPYYTSLQKKSCSLLAKRLFDIAAAVLLLAILWPVMVLIGIVIAIDSPGGVFFRQERVTRYGKIFRIHKFRTMYRAKGGPGLQLTRKNDERITKIGGFLRKCRLDELPQLFDILAGHMSFVGTRPEVPRYVAAYTPEMYATLLLPAGVTSRASILYKDENPLLVDAEDMERAYVEKVLPEKMVYNLQDVKQRSFWGDIKIMLQTVVAVCKRG